MYNICKQFIKNGKIIEDFAVELNQTDEQMAMNLDLIYNQYIKRKEEGKINVDKIEFIKRKEIKIINSSNKKGELNIIRYFVEKV